MAAAVLYFTCVLLISTLPACCCSVPCLCAAMEVEPPKLMQLPRQRAGLPPAASTGAAAEYRASIEDSARRLHCGSTRRRSYDCRASVDVRRVCGRP